jgi:hypothetical protein
MAFDGETSSEYPVLVDEMYPHKDHPVQTASLDLHETVEYVNALELRLRRIMRKWRQLATTPEKQRTPYDWVRVELAVHEAEDFFKLNAYAYAHERLREKQEEQNG